MHKITDSDRDFLNGVDNVVEELGRLDILVQEVSGVSDVGYHFIGAKSTKKKDNGMPWLFSGETLLEFKHYAEIFLKGANWVR